MTPLAGPLYAFALLLGVAGIVKLRDPAPTRGALSAAGLPDSGTLVRTLGGAESVTAVAVLMTGSAAASAALAMLYLGFAAFVGYALRSGVPVASCGCFGREDTPPTVVHLIVTVLGAAAGLAAALAEPGPVWSAIDSTPWLGLPFLAATAVLTYLLFVSLTTLARLAGMVASGSGAGTSSFGGSHMAGVDS